MMSEYAEAKLSDFRLKIAKMYKIKPVRNDFIGFYDKKKIEEFREAMKEQAKCER